MNDARTTRLRWQRFLLGVVANCAVVVLMATPAGADTRADCRRVGRSLHSKLVALGPAHPTPSVADALRSQAAAAFRAEVAAHPECRLELDQLDAYYASGGRTPFPYPASDEPAKGFLGPVGWWWNVIYVRLLGRSTVGMVLVGWELFAFPLFMAVAIPAQLLRGAVSAARSE